MNNLNRNWAIKIAFPPLRAFLILFLLGILVYGNAIFHPFVHDDIIFIQLNPTIHTINLREIFIPSGEPMTGLVNTYYRPFLEIFNRVLYKAYGLIPFGYHFINILIHIANAFLIYVILSKIRCTHRASNFFLGMLFLVHPVQTEAVACVSGISNLLFTFFCLSSFYFYLCSNKEKNFLGLSLLLFSLALLSKEQSVVFPIILCLYEWIFNKDTFFIKKIKKLSGFFIILGVYFFIRKVFLHISVSPIFDPDGEVFLRLASIPATLLMYGKILLFPYDLHYYRSTDILAPSLYPTLICFGVMFCVGYIILKLDKQRKANALFGVGWFFICLLPTLNIVPLVTEYSLILTSEHFLYLPMVGFFICFLELWPTHFSKKRYVQYGSLILIIVCILFSQRQNEYWRGEVPLFKRTLAFERLGRVHILLAYAYLREGELQKSNEQFERGRQIMSGYLKQVSGEKHRIFYLGYLREIHLNMAYNFLRLDDLKEAKFNYQKVLRIDPDDFTSLNNMAAIYARTGDMASARKYKQRANEVGQK